MIRSIVIKPLFTLVLLLTLFTGKAFAITIGDINLKGSDSVSIPLTQLDNAQYLDVTVDIAGQSINYILEQVDNDLVLITIKDPLLEGKESLISIKVESPGGSATRLFTYSSDSDQYQISDSKTAGEILKERRNPQAQVNVLIPIDDNQTDETQPEVKFEDGKLSIDIINSTINVGMAVYELARANDYNVLVLPGDEAVFNSPLVDSVSSWEDLYHASNKAVGQILFDEYRRMVRVVGESYSLKLNHAQLPDTEISAISNSGNPQEISETAKEDEVRLVSVRMLVQDYALSNNLNLLEMPGDGLILDQQVENQSVSDLESLAILIRSINSVVDIDDNLNLIRVRKNSE